MRTTILSLLLALSGCSLFNGGSGDDRVCTLDFRMSTVTLLDAAGVPVEGARVDVIRVATDRSVMCRDAEQGGCVLKEQWPEGRYNVMNDGVPVRPQGEAFRVVAAQGEAQAEAILQFGHDGCHVRKLAGPDTLRLRP